MYKLIRIYKFFFGISIICYKMLYVTLEKNTAHFQIFTELKSLKLWYITLTM